MLSEIYAHFPCNNVGIKKECNFLQNKKTVFLIKKAASFAKSLSGCNLISLISCRVVHIISAAVLCPVLGTVLHIILTGITAAVLSLILAGITAAVLGLILTGITAGILGLILTGIATGILAAVPLRIHRIGSVAVSAVVHITVMISHNDSLLFGLVNLLQD